MKAVSYECFGGPEVLRYVDVPDPRPGPGEVLIESAAIGVNFPDIRERLGVYNNPEGGSMTTESRTHVHRMTRIDVQTGILYAEFRAAFEKAAPPFDPDSVRRIVAAGGSWDDVLAAASANAPHDLMVYAVIDADELLSLAGHHTHAVEYLLGNHTIAETMFRHDPKALLYAPLRVLVHSDDDGNAVFSIEKPSTAFGSLGIDAVTEVGLGLDRKVATLLRVIGVDPGDAFDS